MHTLNDFGWNETLASEWGRLDLIDALPARVIADFGNQYKIAMPEITISKLPATTASKMKTAENPKVGDWVAVTNNGDEMTITSILPRCNELFRCIPGPSIEKQIMVTNVDLAFIVQPLDSSFSLARIERFLFQLNNQGIEKIVILNKADLVSDCSEFKNKVENLGVDVIVASALSDENLFEIRKRILPEKTAVILGKSGAGKSTLLNRLIGEEVQETQSVRSLDDRGAHTTVHREMFLLPGGGLVVDTPGVRELQLWGDIEELNQVFPEIATAICDCYYRNCSHGSEERCAVKAGLSEGLIDPRRYSVYQNFKAELEKLNAKREIIKDRQIGWSKMLAKKRRTRIIEQQMDDYFDL